jgi:alkanesulfonate monooxygenase SsuD/methylene tetrahydromethanopterin reductase-like flavin-dependent oxidoreductase (luciferase family)|tara:strand:+ start:214 stop:1311 length:1098 start_codon:yes stop_codon:yes gene_type:complete
MHVGYSVAFQNPENALTDKEVWDQEMRMVEEAEDLGFDSVWTVEHHFTDYTMCPDPLQLLTWVASRTNLMVGTGVVVLPWHDPVRVAEQITLLDNLSGGRLILGVGRGIARVEYEGFRIPMDTSRERFLEYARMIIDGLENGYMEHDGEFVQQPRRDLRPAPQHSFRGRTYAAAVSPEGMPLMAQLGIGLLVIPQKPWDVVEEDFAAYNQEWKLHHDFAPPPPLSGGFCFVDSNAGRAEEKALEHMCNYYGTVMKHYEFGSKRPHEGVKGYEFYEGISKYIDRHGGSGAAEDFARLMPFGTPDQVLEKIQFIRDKIGIAAFFPNLSFAGMSYTEARRNRDLFAKEVLPVLKEWDSPPVGLAALNA